jgi:hypothetical protein
LKIMKGSVFARRRVSVGGGVESRSASDAGSVSASNAYIERGARRRVSWKDPLCVGRYAECEGRHERCEVRCRCEARDLYICFLLRRRGWQERRA